MVKITSKKRLQYCYRIYEQVYYNNTMSINEIAQNTGISRNTVGKYLTKMYKKDILQGPYLRINPTKTYVKYVYLMQFTDPYMTFQRFSGFPHVVYCAQLFGKWNIMVITDTLLDLSQLVGFKEMVFKGARGVSYTPKVDFVSWKKSAHHVEEYLSNFENELTLTQRNVLTDLPWEEQEWKLFSAFSNNFRKKKTPTLKEIDVRYEEYIKWKNKLDIFCTTHTGFYPQGYTAYDHHCFLVSTEYEPQVREVFSFFPTTSFFMEVGKSLMVIISVPDPKIIRWLYCVINAMKVKKIIKKFLHAQFVFHEDLRGLNLQKYEQRGNP
jgi:DNA-binding Lrp family transcriptional regulator